VNPVGVSSGERPDRYRPDPPIGLSHADFVAARARYRRRLAASAQIARLERALALAAEPAASDPARPRR
jgi:hypothetical protein